MKVVVHIVTQFLDQSWYKMRLGRLMLAL